MLEYSIAINFLCYKNGFNFKPNFLKHKLFIELVKLRKDDKNIPIFIHLFKFN